MTVMSELGSESSIVELITELKKPRPSCLKRMQCCSLFFKILFFTVIFCVACFIVYYVYSWLYGTGGFFSSILSAGSSAIACVTFQSSCWHWNNTVFKVDDDPKLFSFIEQFQHCQASVYKQVFNETGFYLDHFILDACGCDVKPRKFKQIRDNCTFNGKWNEVASHCASLDSKECKEHILNRPNFQNLPGPFKREELPKPAGCSSPLRYFGFLPMIIAGTRC